MFEEFFKINNNNIIVIEQWHSTIMILIKFLFFGKWTVPKKVKDISLTNIKIILNNLTQNKQSIKEPIWGNKINFTLGDLKNENFVY